MIYVAVLLVLGAAVLLALLLAFLRSRKSWDDAEEDWDRWCGRG